MGCRQSENAKTKEELLTGKIKGAISQGDIKLLMYYLCKPGSESSLKLDLNDYTFQGTDNIMTNIPAYCILCGRADLFKILNEKYFISIQKLESTLSIHGISALALICSKGYHEMLEYYLPLSLSVDPSVYLSISNCTLNLSGTNSNFAKEPMSTCTYTPIHLAAYYGHIACIKVALDFIGEAEVPWWLDVNFQDTSTGENCALLACKGVHFPMIKYLYNKCAADFQVMNSLRENALQVLLCSAKNSDECETLKIVKYLVEVIGIDVGYSIEETLLVCSSKEIARYIEMRSKEKGLNFNKKDVERKYRIYPEKASDKSGDSKEIIVSHPSSISSISDGEVSEFASVLNHIN